MLTPAETTVAAAPTPIQGAPTGKLAIPTGAAPAANSSTNLPVGGMPSVPLSANPGPDCNRPMDLPAFPAKARALIHNNTQGPLTAAMGLGTHDTLGLCGDLSWQNIRAGGSIDATVPQVRRALGDACICVHAWINDPKHRSIMSDGGSCIDAPHRWIINVNYDGIRLVSR
jgi:hypothetical protein